MLNLCKHTNNLPTATHTHTHSLTHVWLSVYYVNDTRAAFSLMELGKPGLLVQVPGTKVALPNKFCTVAILFEAIRLCL